MTSRRSSYHHKFLIYFSFIHHHLTLQNVLRSDRQKSVYRLKKALKILQHGNQQQLKPDCSYRDSNHSVQFVDLLRRINKIWNRYSISCLRNRYENNAIILAIVVGISQGTQPIIGFNYGARQYHRVREAYLLAVKWNLVVSTIAFIAFQFFPQSIISLFGDGDELYFEFAVLFMRTYLFMVLVNGVQLLSSSFFTAIGKSLKGSSVGINKADLCVDSATLLLPLRFGIMGVLLAGPVADFFSVCAIYCVSGNRIKKAKKMQHILVHSKIERAYVRY